MIDRVNELRRITGGSVECGWMCDEVAHFLYSLVRFYRPELVIQTGHLWGKSVLYILEALSAETPPEENGDKVFQQFVAEHAPQKGGKLISIDPKPMGVPHHQAGIDYLNKTYPGQFEYRRQTSAEFFADFMFVGRMFGIVDGDHTDKGCKQDIDSLAMLGAEVIFVDDTMWIPTLKAVAEKCASEWSYHCQHYPLYNGITILTRVNV